MPEHTRTTIQLHPDTVDHRAVIDYCDEIRTVPVVGWAVVLTVPNDGTLPQLTVEPVVDDDDFGPIAIGDLIEEGGAAELVEIQ
ncbi:hypothetical protein [Saccharothrix sp. ST-888]|uniref:hypothetical protein n=1 Tax=Saccharothrix sp. ST-888 TaxID=1427391 RepID=UPI0005ECAA55|nr:hypothetical protein [Saccharothrix sp. ST-888]KJK56212.1 hypothetical protein UK12_23795 [Saccharothrix sp. ST-888]